MSVLEESTNVNERIILQCAFQEEDQFPCTVSGSLLTQFTCFDIGMACIIMYCNQFLRLTCTRSDERLFSFVVSFMFSKGDEVFQHSFLTVGRHGPVCNCS